MMSLNNISYGANVDNSRDTSKPLTLEKDGLRIAILNFCENEWSIADSDSSGANPMDIIDNTNQIKYARELADYVIVIVHGGHEYYNLPSPRMQKQYRFYADQGADIVVGHHTHCISGNEVYKGVPIYYSLGNFIFTKNNKNDEWYIGLVLEVDILKNEIRHQLHPVKQSKEDFNLSLLTGKDKEQILERIETFNGIIQDESRLNDIVKNYYRKESKNLVSFFEPYSNRYAKFLYKHHLLPSFLNEKNSFIKKFY